MSFIRRQLWVVMSYSLLCTNAWNLSQLDLYPDHYTITDVSIYYIRSFLCIKSTNESVTIPTLIETIWPDNLLPMISPRIFPSDLSHARHPSNCNGIIQAIATAVDQNGLLWVIDNGSKYCHPKLIVFNLMNNEEIHRYHFNMRQHTFTSINISPVNESDCSGRIYFRAFITVEDSDYLIVYSLLERRWWKLRLIATVHFHNQIMFSRIRHSSNDDMIVIPKEIAILKTGQLFVSDECGRLFWTDKLGIFMCAKTPLYYEIKVDYIADLLGTSTALTNDPNGSLYYYLPRDGAVVRWNSSTPLNAQNHDVLYFSSTPIVEIFFGAEGSVWIVRESPNYIDDHCKRILFHY